MLSLTRAKGLLARHSFTCPNVGSDSSVNASFQGNLLGRKRSMPCINHMFRDGFRIALSLNACLCIAWYPTIRPSVGTAHAPPHSLEDPSRIPRERGRRSFLPRLLNPLLSRVHGPLALRLAGHLLARFLVCLLSATNPYLSKTPARCLPPLCIVQGG